MVKEYYEGAIVPKSKKTVCKICELGDHTGTYYPTDLNSDFHKGFTIGKGKILYWMMIWHGRSGHVTVISKENPFSKRWIKGDTLITIHFI